MHTISLANAPDVQQYRKLADFYNHLDDPSKLWIKNNQLFLKFQAPFDIALFRFLTNLFNRVYQFIYSLQEAHNNLDDFYAIKERYVSDLTSFTEQMLEAMSQLKNANLDLNQNHHLILFYYHFLQHKSLFYKESSQGISQEPFHVAPNLHTSKVFAEAKEEFRNFILLSFWYHHLKIACPLAMILNTHPMQPLLPSTEEQLHNWVNAVHGSTQLDPSKVKNDLFLLLRRLNLLDSLLHFAPLYKTQATNDHHEPISDLLDQVSRVLKHRFHTFLSGSNEELTPQKWVFEPLSEPLEAKDQAIEEAQKDPCYSIDTSCLNRFEELEYHDLRFCTVNQKNAFVFTFSSIHQLWIHLLDNQHFGIRLGQAPGLLYPKILGFNLQKLAFLCSNMTSDPSKQQKLFSPNGDLALLKPILTQMRDHHCFFVHLDLLQQSVERPRPIDILINRLPKFRTLLTLVKKSVQDCYPQRKIQDIDMQESDLASYSLMRSSKKIWPHLCVDIERHNPFALSIEEASTFIASWSVRLMPLPHIIYLEAQLLENYFPLENQAESEKEWAELRNTLFPEEIAQVAEEIIEYLNSKYYIDNNKQTAFRPDVAEETMQLIDRMPKKKPNRSPRVSISLNKEPVLPSFELETLRDRLRTMSIANAVSSLISGQENNVPHLQLPRRQF